MASATAKSRELADLALSSPRAVRRRDNEGPSSPLRDQGHSLLRQLLRSGSRKQVGQAPIAPQSVFEFAAREESRATRPMVHHEHQLRERLGASGGQRGLDRVPHRPHRSERALRSDGREVVRRRLRAPQLDATMLIREARKPKTVHHHRVLREGESHDHTNDHGWLVPRDLVGAVPNDGVRPPVGPDKIVDERHALAHGERLRLARVRRLQRWRPKPGRVTLAETGTVVGAAACRGLACASCPGLANIRVHTMAFRPAHPDSQPLPAERHALELLDGSPRMQGAIKLDHRKLALALDQDLRD
mmetsp:Transcript_16311/g.46314  ORF Transcript_16311/g.46314 Transcript_16311/m.46314 type:complete len:303 (-) Transcript_16311:516-1424(-)